MWLCRSSKFDSVTSLLASNTGVVGMNALLGTPEPAGAAVTKVKKNKGVKKGKNKRGVAPPAAVTASAEYLTTDGPPPVHFARPGGFEVGTQ